MRSGTFISPTCRPVAEDPRPIQHGEGSSAAKLPPVTRRFCSAAELYGSGSRKSYLQLLERAVELMWQLKDSMTTLS